MPEPDYDSRINICYLIDNLSLAGTERHLLELIKNLDRNQFNPILVMLDGESEDSRRHEPDNCLVKRLGIKSFLRAKTLGEIRGFSKFLKDHKVQILQLHFRDSTYFGAVAGKLARVPLILRTRRNTGYWMRKRDFPISRLVSRLVHHTLANSEASKQSVIIQERAKPQSVSVIPNGVDLTRFCPTAAEAATRDSGLKRIGMVANLRHVKRVDVFVSAAAKILESDPSCRFEIAGDGPLREEIQAQIESLGISNNVELVGRISDVHQFLSNLDVLVSCSSSEGLSNSLIEGMAMRLPLVATDIPGNRSLIIHESTGLLVPVGDVGELAAKIQVLLNDREMAQKLASEARLLVETKFSQTNAIETYQNLYQELLGKFAKGRSRISAPQTKQA